MKLTVPEPLKATLVDDWEAVTKNNQVSTRVGLLRVSYPLKKLVDLPRNPNVVQILALFEKHVLKTRPPESVIPACHPSTQFLTLYQVEAAGSPDTYDHLWPSSLL